MLGSSAWRFVGSSIESSAEVLLGICKGFSRALLLALSGFGLGMVCSDAQNSFEMNHFLYEMLKRFYHFCSFSNSV